MAAWTTTPYATASSGLMLLLGSLTLKKLDTSLMIQRIWVEPQTKTISCMLALLILESHKTFSIAGLSSHGKFPWKVPQNRLKWEKCRSQCFHVESTSQWKFGQQMTGYVWHAHRQYGDGHYKTVMEGGRTKITMVRMNMSAWVVCKEHRNSRELCGKLQDLTDLASATWNGELHLPVQ